MNLKKSDKISILRGGISNEKDISILTANQVFDTLKNKYKTSVIEVGPNCNKLITDLTKNKPDKVFNCLHGFFGEDGQIQSILNYLSIPYTHSGVLASSLAMNKLISKNFYESLGIKCPKVYKLNEKITFPVIAKPVCGGSSNGLLKIENNIQLLELKSKNDFGDLMIEQYIEGREITVGILNNEICGVMEIISDSEIYDYKNKYVKIASHILNPKLPKKIENRIKELSILAHKKVNCNCISRLDFRYSKFYEEVFLLEMNTQPGLTKNSLLPEMAKDKGITFLELCELILAKSKCEKV